MKVKNEGEKFFPHFERMDRHYPHCLHQWLYHSKNASYRPDMYSFVSFSVVCYAQIHDRDVHATAPCLAHPTWSVTMVCFTSDKLSIQMHGMYCGGTWVVSNSGCYTSPPSCNRCVCLGGRHPPTTVTPYLPWLVTVLTFSSKLANPGIVGMSVN